MKTMRWAVTGTILVVMGCGSAEPPRPSPLAPRPLPGDPVVACRAGIREACAILGLQQHTMQQLFRPIPVQPVQPVRVH